MNRFKTVKSSHHLATGIALAAILGFGCKSEVEGPAGNPHSVKQAVETEVVSGPLVYAASAHIRVVDTGLGRVTKNIDLQKAVRQLIAHPSGQWVVAAASDGVRVIDTKSHVVKTKLSANPARSVEFSADGKKLWVLEHRVEVLENKERTVHPFELVTYSFPEGAEESRETVGQRIVYVRPAGDGVYGVRVTESAELAIIAPGQSLADGTVTEMGKRGVRQGMTTVGTELFLPLEGPDGVAVMRIDLTSGEHQLWPIAGAKSVRGLAHAETGLYINAVDALWVLNVASGEVERVTELEGAHVGLAVVDGNAFLARTVDAPGGSLSVVDLSSNTMTSKIMLEDISPWAIAALPAAR